MITFNEIATFKIANKGYSFMKLRICVKNNELCSNLNYFSQAGKGVKLSSERDDEILGLGEIMRGKVF